MSNKIEKIGENVTLSVIIPYEIRDWLKFLSYKDKKSIKEIVKEALEEYLKAKDKEF